MKTSRMIEAAIFDIDGTLVDSVDLHAECWREALAHFGIHVAFAPVRSQIGKGGDQLLPMFVPKDDLKRRGEEIERYRSDLFKREYLPAVRAFPMVRDLFRRVRESGIRIVLASSAKGDELMHYKRITDIADLVDGEVSGDDVEHSKPCPDAFQAALQRVALTPSKAIAIGDSPFDAQAASGAAIAAIGMLSGGFPEADLRRAGCIAIYQSPADLLRRFAESPLAR
jgi:HAD superfamily hydrolase (TIGR01509 family)